MSDPSALRTEAEELLNKLDEHRLCAGTAISTTTAFLRKVVRALPKPSAQLALWEDGSDE